MDGTAAVLQSRKIAGRPSAGGLEGGAPRRRKESGYYRAKHGLAELAPPMPDAGVGSGGQGVTRTKAQNENNCL